jgi:hypothetical protein
MLTTGLLLITIFGLTDEIHPVELSVNLKVTFPGLIANICPLLLIVATAGLLLVHTPPEVGVILDELPIHSDVDPMTAIVGLGLTVSGVVVIA